jgi:hypothetical protein
VFAELLIAVGALTAAGSVVNTVAALIRGRRDRTGKRTVEVTIHGNTLRVEGDDEAEIARIVQAFVKRQQESEEAHDVRAGRDDLEPDRKEGGANKA